MLLNEVFDAVKRIKHVWVRKDGQLEKKSVELQPLPDQARMSKKPMFPIKKPRYE